MYYIGIDIAKKTHEVCFLDQDGKVLDGNSFKIPNTVSGVDKLQMMLDKYALTPENAQVGMEATGHYWLVLYSWLWRRVSTSRSSTPSSPTPCATCACARSRMTA